MKVNTDVAFQEGKAGPVVVIWDSFRQVTFLSTKTIAISSVQLAELEALNWSFSLLKERLSSRVVWASDAKVMVN